MNERVNFDILTKYISDNHLTVKEFCKHCKISMSTYYKIKQGKDFRLIALFKIARVMKMQMYQLFN